MLTTAQVDKQFLSHTLTVTATVKENKIVPEQVKKAKWQMEVQSCSSFTSAHMQVSGQLHASVALPSGKESPLPTE